MLWAERYVASLLEPPAVSVYAVGGAGGAGARAQPPHNPWQREERERIHEARRQANRARRYPSFFILMGIHTANFSCQVAHRRKRSLSTVYIIYTFCCFLATIYWFLSFNTICRRFLYLGCFNRCNHSQNSALKIFEKCIYLILHKPLSLINCSRWWKKKANNSFL